MDIEERYCEKNNIVEDMLECGSCFDIKKFNVTKCKGKKRKLEYYRREVPGLEYVMTKKMNYIFSSGMTTGTTDGDIELKKFLRRQNAQGITNLQVLYSAIEKADYWGECGLRRINNDIYLVEPGTYQTVATWIDGVHIPVGYLISDRGRYLGNVKIDLESMDANSMEELIAQLKSEGYIWIDADSNEFLNIRNDTSKLHGDPAILRDRERLDLLIATYKRLNYDVVFDGPGRIVLFVKNGYLEAEEGQDLSTKKVVSETAKSKIERRDKAIASAEAIATKIQKSSSDNVIVLGEEFDKNFERLDRVTKATEFFAWLDKDVNIVSEIVGFDATLTGVSKFSGNVAMNAVIDNAVLSCVIPLREGYSAQFSNFLSNIIGAEYVDFDKYELKQTETDLDKMERVTGMIYKLQVAAKGDENADRSLENLMVEIVTKGLHDDKNILKTLKELYELEEGVKPVYGHTYTIPNSVLKNEIGLRENTIDAGEIPINSDGTLADMPCAFLAVDTDVLYLNHFRKLDDTTIEVACGQVAYLANKAKNANQLIPQRDVPVYVIERKGKKLVCTSLRSVKDSVFQDEFNESLSDGAMKEILEITDKFGINPSKASLPI